jgi:hypothetical protein
MSLIANEQAKLSATHLNGIAIALAAVGGIATWVSYLLQATPRACSSSPPSACFVFVCRQAYIGRAEGLDRIEGVMNALELFALLIGPLLMFGAGLVVYFFAMRQAREDRPPAE